MGTRHPYVNFWRSAAAPRPPTVTENPDGSGSRHDDRVGRTATTVRALALAAGAVVVAVDDVQVGLADRKSLVRDVRAVR